MGACFDTVQYFVLTVLCIALFLPHSITTTISEPTKWIWNESNENAKSGNVNRNDKKNEIAIAIGTVIAIKIAIERDRRLLRPIEANIMMILRVEITIHTITMVVVDMEDRSIDTILVAMATTTITTTTGDTGTTPITTTTTTEGVEEDAGDIGRGRSFIGVEEVQYSTFFWSDRRKTLAG